MSNLSNSLPLYYSECSGCTDPTFSPMHGKYLASMTGVPSAHMDGGRVVGILPKFLVAAVH